MRTHDDIAPVVVSYGTYIGRRSSRVSIYIGGIEFSRFMLAAIFGAPASRWSKVIYLGRSCECVIYSVYATDSVFYELAISDTVPDLGTRLFLVRVPAGFTVYVILVS